MKNNIFKIPDLTPKKKKVIPTEKKVVEVNEKTGEFDLSGPELPIKTETGKPEMKKISKVFKMNPPKQIITNPFVKSLVNENPNKYTQHLKISLKNIHQSYPVKGKDPFVLFNDFNLDIPDVKDLGQFVVILGPSGCGKSTILRYITGLQQPTSGEIFFGDKLRTPKDRVGMVFQNYSSLPWFSVIKNVALGLLYKGVKKKDAYAQAQEMINLVGLTGHEHKFAQYPILSGGQLQRVAIARNLATHNEILAMDEPFGALDVKSRLNMQDLLAKVFVKMPGDPTVIFVTHDIPQAVYLADEIVILNNNPGRVHKMIDIDLPYVRDFTIKRTAKFMEYVHMIEDIMLSLEDKK